MKKVISAKSAGIIILIIFGFLIVFHFLVLFHLLPSTMVWGGQMKTSPSNLRTLEIISLIVTAVFATIIAAKINLVKAVRFAKAINVLLWIIFAYLLLNTLGNLVSSSSLEKLVFTPISIVTALLVLRLAIEK
jgi:hypothetical protein